MFADLSLAHGPVNDLVSADTGAGASETSFEPEIGNSKLETSAWSGTPIVVIPGEAGVHGSSSESSGNLTVTGEKKRRFVSIEFQSSRSMPACRPKGILLPESKPIPPKCPTGLETPIPENVGTPSPPSWVGELVLWGSQTLRLRRDTTLVLLVLGAVGLLLSFLFGQRFAG